MRASLGFVQVSANAPLVKHCTFFGAADVCASAPAPTPSHLLMQEKQRVSRCNGPSIHQLLDGVILA